MTPVDLARDRESGYAALVEQHALGVFRLTFGMVGDRATAEDLMQDAFLRAYEQWHQLHDPLAARGWLFTIAANLARQHLRRQRRWRWLPLDGVDRFWDADGVERGRMVGVSRPDRSAGLDGIAELDSDTITPILNQLKADDRAVLVLMGLLDLTAAETAAVLGIQPAAAHKRWQRACARFRAISAMEDSHAM